MKRALDLKGIYVALITPFTKDGSINFHSLEYNVKKFERESNFTGYIVGGSNSEVASLTPEERVDLVSRVRQLIKPTKMILGGATSESTKLVCEMSVAMAEAGADGLLILTPFYFRKLMTEDVIANHYRTVAERSPIPVVIYNNTNVSGIDISVDLLVELAKHPNIRGVKDNDTRKMAVIVEKTRGLDFDVTASMASYILPAVQVGCSGAMVALAGALGPEVCDLYQLAVEKKWDQAIELQNKLIAIDSLLPGKYGVPGLKAAMSLKGFESGHCRLPLMDASQDATDQIKQTLQNLGFL